MHKLLGVIIVLVSLLAGCQTDKPSQVASPLMVKTQVLTDETMESTRTFNGIVEPAELTPLAFRIDGEIAQLIVKPGQEVAKGQIIARLDERKLKQKLVDVKAQFDLSKRQLNRAVSLVAQKLISPAEYDELKANVKLSRANYSMIQNQFGYTELSAPFSGMIGQVDKKKYESVTPGETVATLYRNDLVYVRLDLSDNFLAQFDPRKKNKKYQPRATFADNEGTYLLSYLEQTTEPSPLSHTFEARLSMPQIEPAILPGTSVKLDVNLVEAGLQGVNGFLLPMTAIDSGDSPEKFTLWKVIDGKAKRVAITVSQVHTAGVLVTSGLEKGDEIIISGLQTLREGMRVVSKSQENS